VSHIVEIIVIKASPIF